MKLLAFDTSTLWLSVACGSEGRWATRSEQAGQGHSERLLPLIDDVLAERGWQLADLDAIAFGAGPGSFTGVRIACGVAQGLALGANLPLVPVPTLEALAHTAWQVHGADTTSWRASMPACARSTWRPIGARATAGARWPSPPCCVPTRSGGRARPRGLAPATASRPIPRSRARWASRVTTRRSCPMRARSRSSRCHDSPRATRSSAAHALPLYVRHRVALTTAERAAGVRL